MSTIRHPIRHLKSHIPTLFASIFYLLILLRTAWLTDDTLITLRTVRNLLNGFGPVWNVDERVQTFTHPLWMFVLSSFVAITNEYYYTVLFVSILVSFAATLVVMLCHARTWTVAILACLLLSFSRAYVDYSTSGLENPLTHLLLALFFLLYLRKTLTPFSLFLVALVASLGILNRMDIALIYLPALLYCVWDCVWRKSSWRGIVAMGMGFVPFIAWEIFSVIYYGFLFPNTAYAKLNTHISQSETIYQGALYLVNNISADPMTGFVIIAALVLAFVRPGWKERWISAGIALYLVYIIQIGGDYTLGRFLSAPAFCAIIYLVRQSAIEWSKYKAAATIAIVLLVGLMPYSDSTLFVTGKMADQPIDINGIANERTMALSLSLLGSNRFNRLYESGTLQGWDQPLPFEAGAIGRIGFTTSTFTRVVDIIGLADPLLARLPARYNPGWRTGHPIRVLPEGYLKTRQTGQNYLADENLAKLYDKLSLIIRGDLWSKERFLEIWRFNRGEYDEWIDVDRYRFPDRIALKSGAIERTVSETIDPPDPRPFENDGVLIEFPTAQHAPTLEIGVDLDRFTLVYYNDTIRLFEQPITQPPIRLGELFYHVVQVPNEVTVAGYTDVHLYPRIFSTYRHRAHPIELTHTDFRVTFLDLYDPTDLASEGIASSLAAEQLSELYFYEFFQGDIATRSQNLTALFSQIQQVEAEQWATLPLKKLIDLSQLPHFETGKFFHSQLPSMILEDSTGSPLLNYIDTEVRPIDSEEELPGLHFTIYVEVIERMTETYSLWFNIKSKESDEEWMVYDTFPPEATDRWPIGAVYEVPAPVALDPGKYEITIGFWTSERDRLYSDLAQDVYWINLGEVVMPEGVEP